MVNRCCTKDVTVSTLISCQFYFSYIRKYVFFSRFIYMALPNDFTDNGFNISWVSLKWLLLDHTWDQQFRNVQIGYLLFFPLYQLSIKPSILLAKYQAISLCMIKSRYLNWRYVVFLYNVRAMFLVCKGHLY